MRKSLLILLIVTTNAYSQVCMLPGLRIDQSCKCGPKCDTFFDKEYLNSFKHSKIDSKKLKPILDNQRATASAYNKLVRNIPVTKAELAQVDREAKTLEKMNTVSLARLNALMVKKKKKKLNLNKAVQDYNKSFMASMSPRLRDQIKKSVTKNKGSFLSGSAPANFAEDVSENNEELVQTEESGTQDLTTVGVSESVSEEDKIQEDLEKVNNIDFEYRNEIITNSSQNIFEIVSGSYHRVYQEKRIRQAHQDTEEEKKIKSEITSDIKKMLEIHSEH